MTTTRQLGGETALIGESVVMKRLHEEILGAARVSSPVVIRGESGSGKELVARRVHELGPRSRAPFVALNCASLTPSLVRAELFGNEAGAFTGANGERAGVFEAAHGGTLLLDEIAELSLDAQAGLLRVLESSRVRRVGGQREVSVDVRVLAATHRDLEAGVAEGWFRTDLFYRIDVLRLDVAPLRERLDDLPVLSAHLLEDLRVKLGLTASPLGEAALETLRAHAWPGNVRELRNVLERALVASRGAMIEPAHLRGLRGRIRPRSPLRSLREVESEHIRRVLDHVNGNKTRAARMLGIQRSTLYEKLRELD